MPFGGRYLGEVGQADVERVAGQPRRPARSWRLQRPQPGALDGRAYRLSGGHAWKVHATLSRIGIAGGAVYDALVALAAREHGAPLATRDARARGIYDAVGVKVIVVR